MVHRDKHVPSAATAAPWPTWSCASDAMGVVRRFLIKLGLLVDRGPRGARPTEPRHSGRGDWGG
jgi:hypothetical protein